jgi:hypothetical protein
MLHNHEPFTFIRFSDGELEILRGSSLELGERGVSWSKGQSKLVYPVYDHKIFDPDVDLNLKSALVEAAHYLAPNFFKGIPAAHNKNPEDKRLLVEMNNGTEENLTYSDLFVNANYKRFLNGMFASLAAIDKVTLIGNHRSRPKLVNSTWNLLPVPDHVFQRYDHFVSQTLSNLMTLPEGSIVLSSASSISNILGHRLHLLKHDLNFIDVGTTIHAQVGMEDSLREYQSQALPWSRKSFKRKALYYALGNHQFKW